VPLDTATRLHSRDLLYVLIGLAAVADVDVVTLRLSRILVLIAVNLRWRRPLHLTEPVRSRLSWKVTSFSAATMIRSVPTAPIPVNNSVVLPCLVHFEPVPSSSLCL